MAYSKITVNVCNGISILKHMHILQSFCIAMFLSLFIHNKTPKVFCLTFGVHVTDGQLSFILEAIEAIPTYYRIGNQMNTAQSQRACEMIIAPSLSGKKRYASPQMKPATAAAMISMKLNLDIWTRL